MLAIKQRRCLYFFSVRVHLWDISGSDDYYDTRVELYHQSDGIFITYDVTNQSSFDGVQKWYDEVQKLCNPLPVLVLCGCKVGIT